jgi:Predicted xylanase/chitin deacetylase
MKKITFCLILYSLSTISFSQHEKSNSNVSIKSEEINKTKNTTLGRDQDPKKLNDLSKATISFRKIKWTMLSFFGPRFVSNILYPKSTISYIKTKSKVVAFTIDDGFCGLDNPDGCMVNQVRELFKKHQSKATFFIAGSHCKHVSKNEVELLLKEGHEIANHSMYEFSLQQNTKAMDFESDL